MNPDPLRISADIASGNVLDETPAAELVEEQEITLVSCWNDDGRLAVVEGPDGEPLCEPCAVALARYFKRAAKLSRRRNRLKGCSPTVKSRG